MKCSRYDAFSDPYLDSKIAILKNKLQAENQNQLDFLEDCLVTLRTAEFLAKGERFFVHQRELKLRGRGCFKNWHAKILEIFPKRNLLKE